MESSELESRWAPRWADVSSRMVQWRKDHPRATLAEIEQALDEQVGRLRADMLANLAMASRVQDVAGAPAEERPRCSACDRLWVGASICELCRRRVAKRFSFAEAMPRAYPVEWVFSPWMKS